MRKFWIVSLLFALACGTKNLETRSNPAIDFIGQEGVVEAHVITRGKFQYLISVSSGENAGKYVPDNLAEEYCQDGLKVKFDAELMRENGIVYKPGPTDIPEEDFEAPKIRILAIRKL